jgi:hypothetical protein
MISSVEGIGVPFASRFPEDDFFPFNEKKTSIGISFALEVRMSQI